jgi:two-component system response regulator HydG
LARKCFEVSHRYTVPCDQAGESCPLQRSLQPGQRERVLHLHHTSRGESFENIELSPIRDASSLSDLTPVKSANFTMRNKKAGFP